MKTLVNVHDLKTNYSKYLDAVIAGNEITLTKYGKPVAKFIPLVKVSRQPGTLAGKIWMSDDFDSEVPENKI
jgi:prevent-host-death family protein